MLNGGNFCDPLAARGLAGLGDLNQTDNPADAGKILPGTRVSFSVDTAGQDYISTGTWYDQASLNNLKKRVEDSHGGANWGQVQVSSVWSVITIEATNKTGFSRIEDARDDLLGIAQAWSLQPTDFGGPTINVISYGGPGAVLPGTSPGTIPQTTAGTTPGTTPGPSGVIGQIEDHLKSAADAVTPTPPAGQTWSGYFQKAINDAAKAAGAGATAALPVTMILYIGGGIAGLLVLKTLLAKK